MIRDLAHSSLTLSLSHFLKKTSFFPTYWLMSELRRRIFGSGGDSPAVTPEPSREGSPAGGEEYTVVPAKKINNLTQKSKGGKRRYAWIFGLGGLFGVLVAGFFASNNELMDLTNLTNMNLDSIFDVLPAGLIRDAQAMQVSYSHQLLQLRLADEVKDLHSVITCRNTSAMPLTTTLLR